MPAGKEYMAEGTTCSWSEFVQTFAQATGKSAAYKQVSLEDIIAATPDKEFAREFGDMLSYTSDPGYDGGRELLKAEDIRQAGIACPMTSLKEFMEKADFSLVLSQ